MTYLEPREDRTRRINKFINRPFGSGRVPLVIIAGFAPNVSSYGIQIALPEN